MSQITNATRYRANISPSPMWYYLAYSKIMLVCFFSFIQFQNLNKNKSKSLNLNWNHLYIMCA